MMLFMMMLTTMTAWAGTKIETRTATFYMDGGTSGRTTKVNAWTLSSGGILLHYANNDPDNNTIGLLSGNQMTTFDTNVITNQGYIEFTNLEGTVKSVAFTNMGFFNNMQMYVGLDKNDNSTLLHVAGNASDYDFPSIDSQDLGNVTFEGSVAVSSSNPLKIMFSSSGESSGAFCFVDGTIVITYEVEVEDTTDPGHTFTFAANASSDAITATCTEGSGYHTCGLTNRQVTMPLVADNAPYNHYKHDASLNMTAFNAAGITDIAATFSYKNANTNETLENAPIEIGNYTVTANVTVTYKETAHPFTLTKDFKIYNGTIACDYPQFSISPKPAIADNNVTITFTPLAGETVTSLTLTGAMANMSLDNGITDNHDGTYTFTMVSESLTLDATFSEPDASHFEQTGTDEYTIKTANGWNWFCFTVNCGLAPDGFSGKTVKLDANVSSSEMAGTSSHPFKGTFDGQDNTLTVAYGTAQSPITEENAAPFRYMNGGRIENLHVAGSITSSAKYAAGFIADQYGAVTIHNCRSSITINSRVSGDGTHGGFVGHTHNTSGHSLTIEGCVFDGKLLGSSTNSCGGFIGWRGRTATIRNSLFAPAEVAVDGSTDSYTFVRRNDDNYVTITNSYYTTVLGKRQGRPATTATTAPANLGNATTDYGLVNGYENGLFYNGNYYTPKYGDVVVEYIVSNNSEHAYVTINGEGNNLVGVNITEEVGNIKSVTYERTFSSGVAATVILPFNYICNGYEGGKFYGFKEVTYDDDQHIWVCTMVEPGEEGSNNATSLTANTPYLFMPSDTKMEFPNISSMTGGVVTLQTTTANDGLYGGATTDYDWNFYGTYVKKTWTSSDSDKDYGFAATSGTAVHGEEVVAGQFVRLATGAWMNPMRCYLSYVGTSEPAPARGLTRGVATDDLPQSITVRLVSRNGDVEAIGTLNMDTGEMSFEGWYTLDGVRLDGKPSTKGIYINNGRKVVIK